MCKLFENRKWHPKDTSLPFGVALHGFSFVLISNASRGAHFDRISHRNFFAWRGDENYGQICVFPLKGSDRWDTSSLQTLVAVCNWSYNYPILPTCLHRLMIFRNFRGQLWNLHSWQRWYSNQKFNYISRHCRACFNTLLPQVKYVCDITRDRFFTTTATRVFIRCQF